VTLIFESERLARLLDDTSWQILHELQTNARISFAELGRRVNMSAPAVAERVARLEEAGLIEGYHAKVNVNKLGYVIHACVRIETDGSGRAVNDMTFFQNIPEVIECHMITGVDSFDVRVVVTSTAHLQDLINRLSEIGRCTSSLILSTLVSWREIARPKPND
jgi:Lrp/AsnC family leucine-responsive transcriptional regulator